MKRKFKLFSLAIWTILSVTFGFYLNAALQVNEVLGLPDDNSTVRDLGYISPVSDRLEVGML